MSVALRPRNSLTIDFMRIDDALSGGLEDLLAEHWDEVALDKDVVPLDVDWDRYRVLERQGGLKSLAAKRGGRLIGYNAFFIQHPMHYKAQTWAINDVLYLTPAERTTMLGPRMIREAEARLPKFGVKKVIYHAKFHVHSPGKEKGATLGDLLVRMGYRRDEEVLSKLL